MDAERLRLLERWLGQLQATTVLDVGCFRGEMIRTLLPRSEHYGLDLEKSALLSAEVRFIACDVGRGFPVTNERFDLVFAGEVIEHVLATSYFLEECARVLKPRGHVVLTTPNLASFANLRAWLCRRQPRWVDSDTGQNGHVRYLAPRTLRAALEKAGLRVIHITSVEGMEKLLILPPLYRLAHWISPERGNRLCALACKGDG